MTMRSLFRAGSKSDPFRNGPGRQEAILEAQLEIDVGREDPAERRRRWTTFLRDNFMGLDCEVDAEDLRGSIVGRRVGQRSLSMSAVSRQVLTRTAPAINRETEEAIVVALGMGGNVGLEQGDRSEVAAQGDVFVLETSRPFKAHFASDTVGHAILHVPRSEIARRLDGADDTALAMFHPGWPLQRLFAAFLQGMVASREDVDPGTMDRLVDHALDLLALMIGQGRPRPIEASTHRAAMLLRIKAYVRANLKDPDLTIEAAASALGISTRYVNALLADEETSFARRVLAERLEGARREILDPRKARRQIGEIAMDWGFRNGSHFGRTYKTRFGMTPRDAKATESGL